MPRTFEYPLPRRTRRRKKDDDDDATLLAYGRAMVSRSFSLTASTTTLCAVTTPARASVSFTLPPHETLVTLSGAVTTARTFGYQADPRCALDLRARAGQAHTFTYTGTPGVISLDAQTQYVAALNLRQRWQDDNDLFGIEE